MVFKAGDDCDRCGATFDYLHTYQKHRKLHQCYQVDNKSSCVTCGNDFKNKFLLETHIKRHHNFKVCLSCGIEVTSANLARHLKTHEKIEEKTLNCDTCGKQFQCKKYLKHFNANNIGSIW